MAEIKKRTLSIIFPVYYNRDSLPDLFAQMQGLEISLTERGMTLELIFIDDGSGDGSYDTLVQFQQSRPDTTVVKLSRNFGAISAAKAGIPFITGDCFTIVAADLQEPPEQILAMVDEWLKGSKFTISVRGTRDDPILSIMFSYIYYRIIRLFAIKDYPLTGFDLMLLDKSLLPNMKILSKKVSAQMFAYWMGYTPIVLKYDRRIRVYGRSRWTFRKKFSLFINNLTGFTAAPMRLMGLFGLLVALISFGYGAYILYHGISGNVAIPGFTTLVILLSFFSGFIIVMLAMVGEYLWRVFDIASGKPESIIDIIHQTPKQE